MLQLRPTFSESWYRVVTLKPRMRANAQISRQYYRGDRWYVVRDPAGNQFHRLSDAAYRFVGLLDGSRTVGEAWDLVGGQLADDAPTQPEVIQILSQLYAANLIETDITPDSQVLLRRHKKQMQRKMQGRLMNVLFPRIPIWDPDRFVCRWLPIVRPFVSKIGGIAWLILIISALATILPDWAKLKDQASAATDPKNWVYLWFSFVAIKFIHELGHAFSCRRFGGEVHEMGIMFLVFVPTPYVDASTAWAFPNKFARMFVGAGGMTIELVVASIMAFVWKFTTPGVPVAGIPVNELAYNIMLIASVTTIIFNANPLLRYDGYYILSDFLEIPNLQQKSKEYCLGLIKRHIFRIKSQQPLPPVGQRIQLFVYGVGSSAYRAFVGIAIILMVAYKIPVLGQLMAIGGIITWLVVPVVKLFRYLTIEPELHRKRGRGWAFSLAVIAAVVYLIGFIKFPYHVDAEGVTVAELHEQLNAVTAGFAQEIRVADGQEVHKGDVIVALSDPDLTLQARQLDYAIQAADVERLQAIVTDQNRRQAVEQKLAGLKDQRKQIQTKLDDLQVKAPFDGRVIAPELHNRRGSYFKPGDPVAMVATTDKLLVNASVSQRDIALLKGTKEYRVEVRMVGDVGRVLYATDSQLVPAATFTRPSAILGMVGGGTAPMDPSDRSGTKSTESEFDFRVHVANKDTAYVPGQRAYVRVELEKTPLGLQWYRRFLQLLQTKEKEKNAENGLS